MSEQLPAVLEAPPRRFRPYPEYKNSGVDWLGKIPAHWQIKRLKRVASVNPSKSELKKAPPTLQVSFVPMEAVGEFGGLELTSTKELAEVSNGYTYFREGDLLVAKITPCFENGKGALARGLENGVGFGTTELHVLRPTQALEPRFLAYVVFGDAFRKRGQAEMKGAAGQQRVPDDFVKDFGVPLPRFAEQRVIADFLDRETATIDALVAKKQRVIELLQEKRIALITQAVTKGLDPNVPMKDLDLEWLGEIPAHWAAIRVKSITAEHKQGFYTEQAYLDDGVKLARITDIDDHANVSFTDMPFVQITERAELEFRIKDGDFLFARSGTIGRFGVVRQAERAVFASYLIRFRFEAIDLEFLRYAFASRCFRESLISSLHGGANHNVHAENIKERWIAVPPSPEQTLIAKFLDMEVAKLDAMVRRVRDGIGRLQEFRAALISAAVTGKIDVREGTA